MIEAGIYLIIFIAGYSLGMHRKALIENEGEGFIRKLLTIKYDFKKNHLLNNITLPVGNGTTQIDHILVSTRGIFVIETKHYSGWIFADAKSPKWTQVLYKKKFTFQNPLRQNYKHLKTIQNILDFLPKDLIHSVVVFTGSAEFKVNKPDRVFNPQELLSYINSHSEDVISENRVSFIVGKLECLRYQMSGETDHEHQSYLIKKFGNTYD